MWPLLKYPSSSLLSLGDDGIKNSYTYLWQSLYGSGTWFSGMNYPYGEHIVYTDGQPLLSVTLAALRPVVPLSPEFVLGLMHLLLIFAFWLGMLYLYKTLRILGTHPGFAISSSIFIQLLSPQLLRLNGHYALSYLCFVPMLFYWSLQYHRQGAFRYPIYLFLLLLTFTFLHPYYALLGLVWCGSYSIAAFTIRNKSVKQKFSKALPILVPALLVFVCFKIFLLLTDPVKDRPSEPLVIINDAATTFGRWFLSKHSKIWSSLSEINAAGNLGWMEGNYLGAAPILLCLSATILYLISKMKGRSGLSIPGLQLEGVWIFMAFVALFVSTDYPVIWLSSLDINALAFLKQFRALERVGWLAYYIIGIAAAVFLYHLLQYLFTIQKKNKIAILILVVASALSVLDANGYLIHTRNVMFAANWNYKWFFGKLEGEDWNTFLKDHNKKKENFSALLLLPYTHVGSEKLWLFSPVVNTWPFTLSDRAAFQLQLPQMDVMMSRTSWSQTFKSVRLEGGPFADKEVFRNLPDSRPILLLLADGDIRNEHIHYLLSASDSIGHFSDLAVFQLWPRRVLRSDDSVRKAALELGTQLPFGDTLLGSSKPFFINHYNNGVGEASLFGPSNLPIKEKTAVIADFTFNPDNTNTGFEFSAWLLLDDKDPFSPSFLVEMMNEKGDLLSTTNPHTKFSTDNKGMWFRASGWLPPLTTCSRIRVTLNNEPSGSYRALDEVQIRPLGTLLISKMKDGSVLVNNHLLNRQSKP